MKTAANGDIRRQNRIKTARYILEHKTASRQEIAAALEFSMPTVFQYVNDLIDKGLIVEAGEYGSTGGRKAKILKICEGFRYAAGVEVSRSKLRMVLLDLSGALMDSEVYPLRYEDTPEYYTKLGQVVQSFVKARGLTGAGEAKLLGVGISIPGIIDPGFGILRQSQTLGVSNLGLKKFSRNIPYAVGFENDANNAAYAEMEGREKNTVYLSLNDTVGGAIFLRSNIYKGDNFKSAEFGHIIIVPNGRKCYCGKRGCVDPYCSALNLREHGEQSLERFFYKLDQGDQECIKVWEEYLEYLTLTIENLRVIFDCDIILGGDVGGYMQGRLPPLEDRLRQYNNVDPDLSFIHVGKFRRKSSAIGAAHQVINRFIDNIDVEAGGAESAAGPPAKPARFIESY